MILKGIVDGISDGLKSVLCFTDRAYIKVNGKRIKRITTSDIIDNVFQENVGNEVEFSTRHSLLYGNIIYSIKEQSGEINKIGVLNITLMFLLRTLLWLICYGAVMGLYAVIMLINDIDDSFLVRLPVVLFFLPIVSLVRDIICRNKIK